LGLVFSNPLRNVTRGFENKREQEEMIRCDRNENYEMIIEYIGSANLDEDLPFAEVALQNLLAYQIRDHVIMT
jgi:hypothetical protein